MLDLRGHGDSAPSAEGQYSAASMAADVESFVTERDLYTRPLAVVGVGLGAAVGLAFASAQPQLVRYPVTSPHRPLLRAHATTRSVRTVCGGCALYGHAPLRWTSHLCTYAFVGVATPSVHLPAAEHRRSEHEVNIYSELRRE
jgi:pimeloyl-ACP methyl ester carboxylesterase